MVVIVGPAHSFVLLAPFQRPIGHTSYCPWWGPLWPGGLFSNVLYCNRTPSPPTRKAKVRRVRLFGRMCHAAVLYDPYRQVLHVLPLAVGCQSIRFLYTNRGD